MDSSHNTPFDPDKLASDALAAGLVLVSAAEVAALAGALQPLLEQHSPAERRAVARAWLVGVICTFRACPLAVASEPGALDLDALWERACAEGASPDAAPLLRWRTILCLAERLAPWFSREGFGELDLGRRTICTRAWVVEVLEQLRASPIPLATGAQLLDAPALLRRRAERWASDDRERR
jgi:hypothetical protein